MRTVNVLKRNHVADYREVENIEDQVVLARQAADGDESSRTFINRLIHPIITYQTNRFCKRFCRENRYRYTCTLQSPTGNPREGALLCEYGNASYAWMLEDLTHRNRLLQFKGKNGARINDYLYFIANSLPFYERWKDWRFGRRVHVPTYIQDLSPDAGKIFFALRAGETIPEIAHKLNLSEQDTEEICQQTIILLTEKNRLYLLDPPRTVSLSASETDDNHAEGKRGREMDIDFYDESLEQKEEKRKLRQAWDSLSVVEQFVLEAMLIEEQDAEDVLYALKKLNINIKRGVAAEDTNRQQLYYFRRKTLSKLADLISEP